MIHPSICPVQPVLFFDPKKVFLWPASKKIFSHDGTPKNNFSVLTALQSGLREAAQVPRSFLGPKLTQKSDCITLHLNNQAFWSQPKPTQCDHNNCMYLTVFHRTVLHDAWYCIVGFGAQTVSRKTPIYLIKSSTTNDGVGATCTNQDDKSNFLTFAHILPRFCQKRLIVLPNNFGFPPDKVLKKAITNPTEPKQINI